MGFGRIQGIGEFVVDADNLANGDNRPSAGRYCQAARFVTERRWVGEIVEMLEMVLRPRQMPRPR
jgi:hypothetical protein